MLACNLIRWVVEVEALESAIVTTPLTLFRNGHISVSNQQQNSGCHLHSAGYPPWQQLMEGKIIRGCRELAAPYIML